MSTLRLFGRKYGVRIMLLMLVLVFSVVSALAQTPVPPPTSDELVASTFTGMTTHFPIIPVAVVATIIMGLIVYVSRRFLRVGR